jgi:hypothetical protein
VSRQAATSLVLAMLPSAWVGAQQPNLTEQEIDRYIEFAGFAKADEMLWCDPVPNCDTVLLKAADSDEELTVIVVMLGGAERREQREFLERYIRSIRASGGKVFQAAHIDYYLAVAVRRRLSAKEFP